MRPICIVKKKGGLLRLGYDTNSSNASSCLKIAGVVVVSLGVVGAIAYAIAHYIF